ncbi:MAG TPA: riboflavin synthase [Aquifex aeolicus]|nr:riboflavin synthase [Aquifex aeolicus]
MFTGLIEDLGRVIDISVSSKGAKLVVETKLSDIKIGDSVSVNGACLTVTEIRGNKYSFDVSPETLKRTNLGLLRRGDYVNLERALKIGDRLGGHIVQGHVDFTSKIKALKFFGKHYELVIEIPNDWISYIVEKGSIAIDGISLTVNYMQNNSVYINIIPHTYEKTNLRFRRNGDLVNVETDIIGKYVINYISAYRKKEDILEGFLKW